MLEGYYAQYTSDSRTVREDDSHLPSTSSQMPGQSAGQILGLQSESYQNSTIRYRHQRSATLRDNTQSID